MSSNHPETRSRLSLAIGFAFAATALPSAASAQSTTLAPVVVTGQAQLPDTVDTYEAPPSGAATGFVLTPRQTPQSVSTLTRQQLDDQGITTLDEALGSTTGITSFSYDVGSRTTYRARGFNISEYKIDGMSVNAAADFSGAASAINMDLYDRMEVVRGANGLLGGTGDPSATINLERKRPGRELAGEASLSVGSWSKRRGMADVNVPLTADGSIRARVVASGEKSDTFRDRQQIREGGLLANVEADLTANTTAGLGITHQTNRTDGASWGANVPIWFADGSDTDLARSTNPVADWSYTERRVTTAFGSLRHRLDNGWGVNLALSHTRSSATNNMGVLKANNQRVAGATQWGGFWNQDGTGGVLNGIHSESEARRWDGELSLTGPFSAFGREHELLFGLNGSRVEDTSYAFSWANGNCSIAGVRPTSGCQYRLELPPVADWRTWDGSYADFDTHRTNARTESVTRNIGGYAAARLNPADAVKVILGLRRSHYDTYSDIYDLNDVGTRGASNSQKVWTPFTGLVVDVTRTTSVYASYTSVFKPQTQRDTGGDFIRPITGQSYEAGVKGEFFDGGLNASLSLFHAVQKNVARTDGANTTPDGAQAYVANGTGVKSKGFDIELAGSLTPNWNVFLGYTHLIVDDAETLDRTDPRNLLRLSTAYRLPGAWRRLTIGGGMSLQSDTTQWSNLPGRPVAGGGFQPLLLRNPGYALFHAMARYEISNNVSAALNISNLFDKTYYRQYGFYDGLIYGEPRRITLTLQARF